MNSNSLGIAGMYFQASLSCAFSARNARDHVETVAKPNIGFPFCGSSENDNAVQERFALAALVALAPRRSRHHCQMISPYFGKQLFILARFLSVGRHGGAWRFSLPPPTGTILSTMTFLRSARLLTAMHLRLAYSLFSGQCSCRGL